MELLKITDNLYFYSKNKPVGNLLGRGSSSNVFVLDQGNETWLIDVGVKVLGRAKRLLSLLKKNNISINITKVFVTHAHSDHINASDFFKKEFDSIFYVHKKDRDLFENNYEYIINQQRVFTEQYNLTDLFIPLKKNNILIKLLRYSMGKMPCVVADVLVEDGDVIEGENFSIKVIHTPGHTDGHCCYYIPEIEAMFLGDLIDPYYDHKPPINLPTSSFIDFKNSISKLTRYKINIFCAAHAEKIHYGYEHNQEIVEGTLEHVELAYKLILDYLKNKKDRSAYLTEFKKLIPKRIWTNQERLTVPFAVLRYCLNENLIKYEKNERKFFLN